MPVKIRLQRHGRIRKPIYHIVIADSRAPRDGKIIERVGQYDPNTNPATIDLDFDKSLEWLQKGAQPTDTCRAILSYKGVLMKKHLLDGAKKGAFSEEEAETKFNNWLQEKESAIQKKIDGLDQAKKAEEKKRLEAESAIKDAMAEALAKKNSELAKELEGAEGAEDAEGEATEAPAETEAATETPAAETEKPAETPAAEVESAPEAPAAEAEKPAEEDTTEKKAE